MTDQSAPETEPAPAPDKTTPNNEKPRYYTKEELNDFAYQVGTACTEVLHKAAEEFLEKHHVPLTDGEAAKTWGGLSEAEREIMTTILQAAINVTVAMAWVGGMELGEFAKMAIESYQVTVAVQMKQRNREFIEHLQERIIQNRLESMQDQLAKA